MDKSEKTPKPNWMKSWKSKMFLFNIVIISSPQLKIKMLYLCCNCSIEKNFVALERYLFLVAIIIRKTLSFACHKYFLFTSIFSQEIGKISNCTAVSWFTSSPGISIASYNKAQGRAGSKDALCVSIPQLLGTEFIMRWKLHNNYVWERWPREKETWIRHLIIIQNGNVSCFLKALSVEIKHIAVIQKIRQQCRELQGHGMIWSEHWQRKIILVTVARWRWGLQ